jgi:hypothetical protein
MEKRTPISVDLLPVREAFRALRHGLRESGRFVRRASARIGRSVPLPEAAGTMLQEVEGAAKNVDRLASNLGRRLLGGHTEEVLPGAVTLKEPDDSKLAAIAYSALKSIVAHLGHHEAYVSEAAALEAFSKIESRSELREAEAAAIFVLSLTDENVVRYPDRVKESAEEGGRPEAVPVFALMLWLQSECDDPYAGEALHTSADLSLALAGDILPAVESRDIAKLAALFDEFSSHV